MGFFDSFIYGNTTDASAMPKETQKEFDAGKDSFRSIYSKLEKYGTECDEVNDFDIDLRKFMGQERYGQYKTSAALFATDPLRGRCGIIDSLFGSVDYRLRVSCLEKIMENDNDGEEKVSFDEIHEAIRLLKSHLKVMMDNPSLGNARGRYLYYMSVLLNASCCFWSGEMLKAASCYMILMEWEGAKENTALGAALASSIFTIFGLMGLRKYVDVFLKRYKPILDSEKNEIKNSLDFINESFGYDSEGAEIMSRRYRELLKMIDNRYDAVIVASAEMAYQCNSFFDKVFSDFEDNGVDFGYWTVHPDFNNNTLAISQGFLGEACVSPMFGCEANMVILEDLQGTISRQRDQFFAIVKN